MQRINCTNDDAGVARPTLNNDFDSSLLIKMDTGILIPKEPTRPCIITKVVCPHPLKYPKKQKINEVSGLLKEPTLKDNRAKKQRTAKAAVLCPSGI